MVSLRSRLAGPHGVGIAVAAALGFLILPEPSIRAAAVTNSETSVSAPGPESGSAGEETTEAVLDRWLARQALVKSWNADFVQTRSLKTLAKPLVAEGRVWFAAPNRFRWELGNPPQSVAIRQSNAVLVIYPALRRAERYPIDAAATGPWKFMLTLLEAGFPSSRPELESRFRVTSCSVTHETFELALEPRAAPARRMVPRFTVVLDRTDLAVRATEMTFADGSVLRNDFAHSRINPPVEDQLFAPEMDSTFKITEPLGTHTK